MDRSRGAFKLVRLLLVASLLAGVAGLASVANATTNVYQPEGVSTDANGDFAGGGAENAAMSDDGRYVVFESDAMLTLDDQNGSYTDIYFRDRLTGDLTLVNEPRVGMFYLNESSVYPSISDDGTLVAFYSPQDLVPEDTNGFSDMYVRNMITGAYHKLDVWGDGSGITINQMKISGDGTVIVFETEDEIASEDYGRKDIYLYDLATDTTTWVTQTNVDMAETDRGSRDPDVSDDGRYVVFVTGKDLDPTDTNGGQDVYLADMDLGTYTVIDARHDGSAAGDEAWYPRISGDGSTIVFYSDDPFVPEDEGHQADVYSYVISTGATTWLTQWPESAVDWDRGARSPAISDDGRWVVCYTGKDLVSEDTNGVQDLYLVDGQSLEPKRLDVNAGSGLDGSTWGIGISGDGSTICFDTAYSLNSNDSNGSRDVWVLGDPLIAPLTDFYTTGRNVALSVPAGTGVLVNDIAAGSLSVSSASTPAHGTVNVSPDGSFVYTPDADYQGPDSFSYTVTDDLSEATGSVFVDVVNFAPVPVADAYNVSQNGHLYVAAPGLLGNDSDANGDTLSAYKSADPANGSVTVAPDGAFTYAPNPGFVGQDQFTYEASDGQEISQPAVVTITVLPSGAPVAGEVGAIFRFYNRLNGTHFYTASATERDSVLQKLQGVYNYEGVAFWTNPAVDTKPLYRFYNKKSNSHFYTASETEKAFVQASLSGTFTYEGVGFTVSTQGGPGKTAIYRFFNVRNGCHFYTSSASERDHVIATWPSIYRYEGEAFYVSPPAQ